MSGPLGGKVALVTGASRGIGRAVGVALARAGAGVAVNCRSREDAARQTEAMVAALGRRCLVVVADVSASAEVTRLVAAVEAGLGPVDVLVNNAGAARPLPVEQITERDFDEMVAVNLKSAFLLTQAVLPGMRARRWGRVINLSSVAAQTGGVVGPHYAASKAGLHGLTHAYASLLAKEGVTVNCVAPALIETEMVTSNPPPRPAPAQERAGSSAPAGLHCPGKEVPMPRFTLLLCCALAAAAAVAAPAPTPRPDIAWVTGWDKPVGDCRVRRDRDKLTVIVPGKGRAKLLRDVRGDFSAEVRVWGWSPAKAGVQHAGLLLSDTEQSLRVVRDSGLALGLPIDGSCLSVERKDRGRLVGAVLCHPVRSPYGGPVLLRLQRRGGRVLAAFSGDGTTWEDSPENPYRLELPHQVKVGVTAEAEDSTGFEAAFGDFKLTPLGPSGK